MLREWLINPLFFTKVYSKSTTARETNLVKKFSEFLKSNLVVSIEIQFLRILFFFKHNLWRFGQCRIQFLKNMASRLFLHRLVTFKDVYIIYIYNAISSIETSLFQTMYINRSMCFHSFISFAIFLGISVPNHRVIYLLKTCTFVRKKKKKINYRVGNRLRKPRYLINI